MKSTHIIVLILLSVLTFGGTSTALAQAATTPGYESTFATLKDVLRSIQNFFDTTLATVTGSYDVVGAVTVTTPVTADFGLVEYYPNLKTKIGFAQNFISAPTDPNMIAQSMAKLDAIGPGLVCSNNEFDMWYRYPDPAVKNPALEIVATNAAGRTTEIGTSPTDALKNYQTALGDKNFSQLYQLTGAPAQFQLSDDARIDTGDNNNVHPAPTDPVAAAAFIGKWAASSNHAYPVLWSFWNEPIHTFATISRTRDIFGSTTLPKETKAEFELRRIQQSGSSSAAFSKLYAQHERQVRPAMHRYSQIGLASFLTADFNPYSLTPDNKEYFQSIAYTLKNKYPATSFDFVSFNNFSDGLGISLSGARTALGVLGNKAPFLIAQYSPGALQIVSADDIAGASVSKMKVSIAMLNDLAMLERAADFRSICMSYWIGSSAGKYSFIVPQGGKYVENEPYKVISLFAQLPTVRTRLNLGGIGAQGVQGLAGVSQAKAAVLLWNEGSSTVTFPLTLARLPKNSSGVASMQIISEGSPTLVPSNLAVANGVATISMPPRSVAFVEIKSTGSTSDPLLRRNSISSGSDTIKTRFLQTKVLTDRTTTDCTAVTKVPDIATSSCYRTTGTYGFYDSVRSTAYLGRGEGATAATVTATYESLPPRLYVNPRVFAYSGAGISSSSLPVDISVYFPVCQQTVRAVVSPAGYYVLDFDAAGIKPLQCRIGKSATITFTMPGATQSGTQAEIFVSSSEAEAIMLAEQNRPLSLRNIVIDTAERLVVKPFFPKMTGVQNYVLDGVRVTAITACPSHDAQCPRYTGPLAFIAKDGSIVHSSFKTGEVVRAVRGRYTVVTAESAGTSAPVQCPAVIGEVETSKGILNNVTVECP